MALPKDPRQLMINLMYLVLTAMLALNITKEVLTAFSTINTSIEGSNGTIIGKNNKFYETFDAAQKTEDSAKVRPLNDKAKEIKAESEKLYSYLESWKEQVITKSGGYEVKNGNRDIKSPDDINTPTLLFVEEKKGDELRKKMNDYVAFLLSRVDSADAKEAFKKQIPIQLADPKKSEDNPGGDWSYGTFHNIPVVASIAMLSKFQNDIKNSESMVVEYLLKQVHAADFKFDQLAAIAVPKTSYALDGQEIEATVMLAAYNKNVNPSISSSAGRVDVKDGVGILKFKASGAGQKTVNGRIMLNKNGTNQSYDYKFDYTVGTAGASLQLDKMNVMYIGVANPVTLSASGYNIEDVTLSLPGADLTKTGKGTYSATVSKMGTLTYTIGAARGKDANSKISTGLIRIKTIPDPTAKVGQRVGGLIPTSQAKAQLGVVAELSNFDFEARFKVTSFRFVYLPKIGDPVPIEVSGASFNAECNRLRDRSKAGDRWIFENIKAIGPDKTSRNLNPITLTLN